MSIHIVVLVGSLRRDSYNRRLARAVQRQAPQGFTFSELQISDLPLYNQDDESSPTAQVTRLKDDIKTSQGVIFVVPEYNRSLPGVMKNAIDHASRPYGQNAWAGKPAGIIGASPGAVGTAVAQQHLRGVLGYLDMPTLGQPEVYLRVNDQFFTADGDVANSDSRKFVKSWMDAYAAWVQRFAH
jgi:chromate reductase